MLIGLSAYAQKVERRGNTFVQIPSDSSITKKSEATLTKYTYQTKDGTKYPIYMSKNGKCFIMRISKNGKRYRQYLPQITKQLQDNK